MEVGDGGEEEGEGDGVGERVAECRVMLVDLKIPIGHVLERAVVEKGSIQYFHLHRLLLAVPYLVYESP